MSVGKSIYKLLKDDADVFAIVGTGIYPHRVPQTKPFPAITYTLVTTLPTDQKDSVSHFDKIDYDIECWSNKYSEVTDLAEKVRTALDRKSINTEGSNITHIVFVREIDGFDNAAELYQKILQFRFIVIR